MSSGLMLGLAYAGSWWKIASWCPVEDSAQDDDQLKKGAIAQLNLFVAS